MNTTIRDNVAIGEPDILIASSVASNNLGAKCTSGDGRSFRFSYDGGTALVPGMLYQAVAQDDTNLHDLTCASVSVGDTVVSVTSTASTIAANALAGGFLTFTNGGQTYAIAGNTSASSSAFSITLSDPIRVAISSPLADVALNSCNNIVINPTTATSAPVGAAIISTSGSQYAWLQTEGIIALKNDGVSTINAGSMVAASITTAGNITKFLAGTTPCIVGVAMETIESTEYGLVKISL